jgi:tRNA U34 5-carboxymethylaminomethyl modifying GTPase MnmE/TrmE
MSTEQYLENLSGAMFDAIQKDIGEILQTASTLVAAERDGNQNNPILLDLEYKLKNVARKFAEKAFRVAVVGLTKSGKSTLLNAWLGARFLPDSNTPETARIVRIRHTPGHDGTLLDHQEVIARSPAEVNKRLREMNAAFRAHGRLPPEDELVLRAPLVALAERRLDVFGFDVLDTPGPNEAGTEQLRAKVMRLLDDADVIVYLLDYSKLNTSDEAGLFEKLGELRPELLARYSERMFFAVNKIDLQNSRGRTPEETAEYVVAVLRRGFPILPLSADRILLVSALYGLLSRLVLSGQADAGTLRDFAEIAFGKIGARKKPSMEDCQKAATELLEESRLQELEDRILAFVYARRGRLLFQSQLEDLERHLAQLHNYCRAVRAALSSDIEKLTQRLRQLRHDRESAHRGMDTIKAAAAKSKADITTWTEEQFQGFQVAVRDQILRALKGEEVETPPRWWFLPRLLGKLKGRISRLLGFKKESEAEKIRQEILKANEDILAYLGEGFEAFRTEFESQAHERQTKLFAELEALVNPLVALIASKVGEALAIELQPVSVKLRPPSLDELHSDIDKRVDEFIRRHDEKKKHRELVKKGCWIFSKDEYEDVETEHTTFSTSVENLSKFWEQQLVKMAETSVATAKHLIDRKVLQVIQKAQAEIDNSAEGYVQIVEHELAELKQGEAARRHRLAEVKKRLEAVECSQHQVDCGREALETTEEHL